MSYITSENKSIGLKLKYKMSRVQLVKVLILFGFFTDGRIWSALKVLIL